ncbi:MAG: hypothetical protein BRD55_01015 [Bacteroidetes bacterium SW_9_63_38]|nr:MAG: hypothetical protein BRD55_01015 [Bacteroidetes bacterium SW_9_63_38]
MEKNNEQSNRRKKKIEERVPNILRTITHMLQKKGASGRARVVMVWKPLPALRMMADRRKNEATPNHGD